MTHTEARTLKARQIRICRHYLAVAKNILGLGPKSTTVRYWTDTLAEWRAISIEEITQHYEQREN